MSLREKKKSRVRQAIIAAALRLFSEQGFDATTIDQIAAAAQVGRRTVFRYFPTKESLVLGGDRMDPGRVIAELKQRRPGEDDVQLVTRVLSGLRARLFELNPEQNILTHQLVRTTPALAARSYLLILGVEDLVVQALVGDNDAPEAVLRIRLIAATVIIAIDTAVSAWIEGGMQTDLDALIRSLSDHLRNGFSRVG